MLLGRYRNGNYETAIYSDGTRIRETDEMLFIPSFAESIDVQISNRCDNGCRWCYAGCTPDGETADLPTYRKLFASIHPYTEFAVNMNFPLQDGFEWFLSFMKEHRVIINVTIAQRDFVNHQAIVRSLVARRLVYGIGVSYTIPDSLFLRYAIQYKNLVVHTINSLIDESDIDFLSRNGLKLLILGYKDVGRGKIYRAEAGSRIERNQRWLYDHIKGILPLFQAVSFDNLALQQLDFRRYLSDDEWAEFYSGDEGQFSFYLDLVGGTYAVNSLSRPIGRIGNMDADQMFQSVREYTAKGGPA